MVEEQVTNTQSLPDRAARYREVVERVVREVGEHPLCELKRSYALSTLAEKIEFVKDVQSICTSRIDSEKFLVVGADEHARCFVNVQNLSEFDEAKLRQQLSAHLDPVPEFEPFALTSTDGHAFMLFVFPRQKTRIILATKTVIDDSSGKPRLLLREGDLWTKGSSTGRRLATRDDWAEIFEDIVEREAEKRTRQRTAHLLERATAQEKIRNEYGAVSVPSFGTDEEYRALIESLCASKDRGRYGLLLERLRDDLIEEWYSIDAFADDDVTQLQGALPERAVRVRNHKTNVFLPAMQRLTTAAIYTTKNEGPLEFLAMAVQLLEDVYETTNRLRHGYLGSLHLRGRASASSAEHVSHTIPALESLVSLHLIGAYIAKRRRFGYLPIILRRLVREAGGDMTPELTRPLAFWPLRGGWGEPATLRQPDGRIQLCAERATSDPALLKLFGSEAGAIESLCQYELLLQLNCYLTLEEGHTPETVAHVKKTYPEVDFRFFPSFVTFPLTNITDVALRILRELKRRNEAFVKPLMFDDFLAVFLRNGGEDMFARYLQYVEHAKRSVAWQVNGFPGFPADWPKEIAEAIKKVA
jgi:hypothetical protein